MFACAIEVMSAHRLSPAEQEALRLQMTELKSS